MPGWEKDRAVSAVASPSCVWIEISSVVVPWNVGKTVNTTQLEERQRIGLIG